MNLVLLEQMYSGMPRDVTGHRKFFQGGKYQLDTLLKNIKILSIRCLRNLTFTINLNFLLNLLNIYKIY